VLTFGPALVFVPFPNVIVLVPVTMIGVNKDDLIDIVRFLWTPRDYDIW